MANLTAVILAAGKGTRMKSKLPKVLHKVGGHPMLEHVMDAAEAAGCRDNVVVIGHGAELVRELVGDRARIALQAEQLGTGHAVLQAADTLKDFTGTVMILCGDTPLLEADELEKFYAEHVKSGAAATVMSALMDDPFGYGRILRDANGDVAGIVEQKDASEEQKQIKEINTGNYWGGVITADSEMIMGVNSRRQLAEAESVMRRRIAERHMDDGVTLMDPASTFIEKSVKIAPDTVIYPNTWLQGATVIGEDCEIGPNVRLENVKVADGCRVEFTHVHDCEINK